jgi:glucan phosphoethanolaminetransferase (alkaline phosphatase superfamily)
MSLKLINEIRRYILGTGMRNFLEQTWGLLASFLFTIINAVPSPKVRRALTAIVTIIIVIIIIVAGVAVVYYVVISPGAPYTTTIYP